MNTSPTPLEYKIKIMKKFLAGERVWEKQHEDFSVPVVWATPFYVSEKPTWNWEETFYCSDEEKTTLIEAENKVFGATLLENQNDQK